MIKSFKVFAFLVLSVFLSFQFAFSADFQLTKIGSMDTEGNKYSEWWYSGTNPTLMGTGTESSTVNIKVGENTYTANTDASGNWSQPLTLGQGDYNIQLSQGSNTYSFTLHVGQSYPGTTNSNTTTSDTTAVKQTTAVPVTGFNQLLGLTFGMGVVLFATYLYMLGSSPKNSVSKRKEIEE